MDKIVMTKTWGNMQMLIFPIGVLFSLHPIFTLFYSGTFIPMFLIIGEVS